MKTNETTRGWKPRPSAKRRWDITVGTTTVVVYARTERQAVSMAARIARNSLGGL